LSACSSDDDDRLARDLTPPQRMELMPAPPVAPDTRDMHPALALAKTRGLKTNVYFNEELQQNIARLAGMEETLGRLQNDLQGTAMAMQRVEMMRQEIEAMNIRMQALQEKLIYAGPVVNPTPVEMPQTMVVEETIVAPHERPGLQPTPLMGDMADPVEAEMHTAQISQPVVDEKKSDAKAEPKASAGESGVQDVRIGVHADSVRVVLDVGGKDVAYNASVDASEKLLTVELPNTPWKGDRDETLKGNPLIASYTAQDSGKGSIVVFTLKGDTKIASQKTLKGDPTRLVIDLSR
ncbi:MAG TPA: hypothetical protein VIN59_07830, partial [Alphaproteobacteria bacterium]